MLAVSLARQSRNRDDQDDSISIAFQHRRNVEEAARRDDEIVFQFEDIDVSGHGDSRAKRDGLRAMLAYLKANPAVRRVYIYNVSRLARDTFFFLELYRALTALKPSVELRSASESIEDPTIMVMIAAMAERERTQLSNNVAWAVRECARQGRMILKPPFGYTRLNGEIQIVPSEAAIVRRVFVSYVSGYTTGEILDALHRDSIPTPTGLSTWQRTTLTRMLGNRAYNGEIAISETRDPIGRVRPALTTTGNHEAIIPPETFERAQAILRSERAVRRLTTFPAPWLAGAVRCAACGQRLYVELLRSKPDRLQPYWVVRCASSRRAANTSRPSVCGGQSIGALRLIEPVARRALADDLAGLIEPEAAYALAVSSTGRDHRARGDELRAVIEETDERLARLWLARETGDITIELYRARHAILSAHKDAALRELASVPVIPELGAFAGAREVLSGMAGAIMRATDAELREAVTILGAVATVDVREKAVSWSYEEPFSWLVGKRAP